MKDGKKNPYANLEPGMNGDKASVKYPVNSNVVKSNTDLRAK